MCATPKATHQVHLIQHTQHKNHCCNTLGFRGYMLLTEHTHLHLAMVREGGSQEQGQVAKVKSTCE